MNDYDGVEHDYTKKKWIEHTEIMLCKNAPEKYMDRGTLWNAVEMAEKAQDAQLCREIEVALPKEMTLEQQIALVREFCNEELVSQGMIVDYAIHCPPVKNDRNQPIDRNGKVTRDISKMQFSNPHAHILATMRPINEDGSWQNKTETEYICIRGMEERGFTAKEFKTAKEEGWLKQYRFWDGGKKIWLTMEEGKERELERINRSPKTTPYGRENELIKYWNDKNRVIEWRKVWENVVNRTFERMNSDIRIDCRSLEAQGREEIPIHMSSTVYNMEKRLERQELEGKQVKHSEVAELNRQIRDYNRFMQDLNRKINNISKRVKELVEKVAFQLEGLRAKLIGNEYEAFILSNKYATMKDNLSLDADRIRKYENDISRVEEANKISSEKIRVLQNQLKNCSPFQLGKKASLQNQIKEEQEKVESRKAYMNNIAKMYGYSEHNAFEAAKEEYSKEMVVCNEAEKRMEDMKETTEEMVADYRKELEQISAEDRIELVEAQNLFRDKMESLTKTELSSKYQKDFSEDVFSEAKKKTDKLLNEKAFLQRTNFPTMNHVLKATKKIVVGRKR